MKKKQRLWLLGAAFLIAFVTLSGCREQKNIRVSLNSNLETKKMLGKPAGRQPLRFAIATMISPEETVTYYKKILDFLADKLGREYDLIQKGTYSQVNDMFREGALDMAFICSGAYVDLAKNGKVEILAVPVVNGATAYHSYIIVPAESPYQSFEDLKGKSFAFVDPISNTGRYYPLSKMGGENRNPGDYFSRYLYTYSHTESMRLVRDGNVDGAAVSSMVYDFFLAVNPEFRGELRVIDRSPPYANPPFVVPADLDGDLKNEMRHILLMMHKTPEGRRVLKELRINKFTIIDDKQYDSVRELQQNVEKQGN